MRPVKQVTKITLSPRSCGFWSSQSKIIAKFGLRTNGFVTLESPSKEGHCMAQMLMLLAFLGFLAAETLQAQTPDMPRVRFQFQIDPKTPLHDLLPVPPTTKNPASPVIVRDVSQVPEVEFQMPLAKMPNEKALKQTAHTMAKINHLNDKKTD